MIKFYIIHKQGDPISESFAKECQESTKRYFVETELFPGIYENIDNIMAEENLFVNPKGEHTIRHNGLKGCFLSHYKLWKLCEEIDIPIGIFEHDALMISELPKNILDLFDDYLNIDYNRHLYEYQPYDVYRSRSFSDIISVKKFEGIISKKSESYIEKIKDDFKFIRRAHIRGAHAYIIKPSGAKKLIKAAREQGILPADIHPNLKYIDISYCEPSIAAVNETMWKNYNTLSHTINNQTVSKRAVIMAGGKYKTWNRWDIKINGETLLERTTRLLKLNNINDIYISSSFAGQHNLEKEYINTLDGNDLGCIIGCKELNGDIYLYGDVYYSETAILKICNGTTNYYGRNHGNLNKPHGEFFAFKPDNEFWKFLNICWSKFQKNEIPRLWSWDLYSYHVKKWDIENPPKKFKKSVMYQTPANWTNIDDETDDFDSQEELNVWLEKNLKT